MIGFIFAVLGLAAAKYVPAARVMGKNHANESKYAGRMMGVKGEIESIYPGIFVHSIQIGASENKDRIASFYDDLNRQVDEICEQLESIEELKDGFDAVGFSQGGQILRAYVQRCNSPPVRNLITVGAQHQGVMDLPGCGSAVPVPDAQLAKVLQLSESISDGQECSWWQRMFKKSVYSDIVQNRIVQAQFFKDPARIEEYLTKSLFLADINNERPVKIEDYAEKLGSLENFVMFKFSDDHQWFGYFDGTEHFELREQPIYTDDWIGLRKLDEQGSLHFLVIEGEHVHLGPFLTFVVWHALGSNCCEGLYHQCVGLTACSTKEFTDMLKKQLPQLEIFSISTGSSPADDSYKSYFDSAERQNEPSLKNGFNAIGLSQGGLLLRALIEKCPQVKVHRLITFGSPLQGVAAYPGCGPASTWAKWSPTRIIRSMMNTAKEKLIPCSVISGLIGRSVYSARAQGNVMPAQYFKDPTRMDEYLKTNKFLTDINNELPNFGYFEGKTVLPMRETRIYKEDWIGLKSLDQRKAIVQIRLPGEHVESLRFY
ncbi:hypothetical protein PSACC_03610 [Paramicrosporidium saccamoebae]|uniref:Palmitoyl-protein thioesterase 1 n=1 Tax=Paramicrosporidium saccamoebae TaxID=1246581 RepID=A0A2H9TFS6_9FUNG|nr:hypothetical protein PSACC_03610 [Paramicrosporidium saccamoebae]